MTKERRQFQRISFATNATLSQGEESWPVDVVDLSLQGALLQMPEGFRGSTHTPIRLQWHLDGLDDPITMEGKICYVRDELCGLSVDTLNLHSATSLRTILSLNLGDDTLLKRDLTALIDAKSH